MMELLVAVGAQEGSFDPEAGEERYRPVRDRNSKCTMISWSFSRVNPIRVFQWSCSRRTDRTRSKQAKETGSSGRLAASSHGSEPSAGSRPGLAGFHDHLALIV